MVYNILTCSGWENEAGGFMASAPCFKSKLGIVILFFLFAIVKKWVGEEAGIPFSLMFGILIGLLPYLVMVFLFGSFKLAFLVGLLGGLGGGYLGGVMFGGGE